MLVPSNYTVPCTMLSADLYSSSFVLNTCTVCVVYMHVCVCVCMCVHANHSSQNGFHLCENSIILYGMPSLVPQAPPLQNTNIEVVQVGRA